MGNKRFEEPHCPDVKMPVACSLSYAGTLVPGRNDPLAGLS